MVVDISAKMDSILGSPLPKLSLLLKVGNPNNGFISLTPAGSVGSIFLNIILLGVLLKLGPSVAALKFIGA